MFLKVSMFALALCSVRAEDHDSSEQHDSSEHHDSSEQHDSSEHHDCSELLQPREDQHLALGRSIFHASGSNNPVIMDIIVNSDNSWIDISPAEEEDKYNVIAANKLGDTCVFTKGEATVSSEGISMTLKNRNCESKREGVLLHTHNDDVEVFLYKIDARCTNKRLRGKIITFLKRSPDVNVTSDSMELYRRQAKCAGIKVHELPKVLCDNEPTE